MTENGNRQEWGKRKLVLRKAYEIGYAVFRIASRMGSIALREHLERQALSLLDAAAVENYGWVDTVSRAIEYLMRFGGDVGLIHEENKETILQQLEELEAYVAGPEKEAAAEPVSLGDIFSSQEPLFKKNKKSNPEPLEVEQAVVGPVTVQDQGIKPANVNSANPEIRQTAILDKIRQSGNCRLRDLLEVLPDYSERTLRYDLQALAEQNAIERIGNGGPAVFYRIRQTL